VDTQLKRLRLALGPAAAICSPPAGRRVDNISGYLGLPKVVPKSRKIALWIGLVSTVAQVVMLRYFLIFVDDHAEKVNAPESEQLAHSAYRTALGYAQLDKNIPTTAVVQYNPAPARSSWGYMDKAWWTDVDMSLVNHQVAMFSSDLECGSLWGGNTSGCKLMRPAIKSLYEADTTAEQAANTCQKFGISYLIARPSDPIWQDVTSWVWRLRPVVVLPEFRALTCSATNQ
jgi:hypothetical protein